MKLFMKNKCNILLLMWLWEVQVPLLVLGQASVMDTATNATCKHATDMWGDPNPNIFYVCAVVDEKQTPLQLHCPQGRGFFNGLGYLGCLPYDHWPACRPTVEQTNVQLAAGCDNQSQAETQPWPTQDPNQFYMCPGIAAVPLLLSCAPGKGFVATMATVGCADWSVWRRQMQCEEFY
ncbi:uncharacterized protein LOC6650598 [Drosophila willistoni]|nr:uncharacterized protein LOC6650598 [Drosophila willistoni]